MNGNKPIHSPRATISEELDNALRFAAFWRKVDPADIVREALENHPDVISASRKLRLMETEESKT